MSWSSACVLATRLLVPWVPASRLLAPSGHSKKQSLELGHTGTRRQGCEKQDETERVCAASSSFIGVWERGGGGGGWG